MTYYYIFTVTILRTWFHLKWNLTDDPDLHQSISVRSAASFKQPCHSRSTRSSGRRVAPANGHWDSAGKSVRQIEVTDPRASHHPGASHPHVPAVVLPEAAHRRLAHPALL